MRKSKETTEEIAPVRVEGAERTPSSGKVLSIVGLALCILLIPMLIINCTLIIKSFVKKDEVPTMAGLFPMIVLTESMYPDIKSGDMIFCRSVDTDEIARGDVITFYDPAGDGSSVVTHQVIEILIAEDGTRSFRTKGVNNNTADRDPVPEESVIGRYTGVRIAKAGKVSMFMQSTYGLIVCVFIPFVLLVAFDLIRRRKSEKAQNADVEALKAELEELRRMKSEEKSD